MKLSWKFSPNRENLIALLVVAILIGMITGILAVGFRYLLLAYNQKILKLNVVRSK